MSRPSVEQAVTARGGAPAALRDAGRIERGGTMADAVYLYLRELLISGRVAPGDRLSLRDVAEALGTSIMPVREAVSRLVAERALEVAPNRAVRVPVMTLPQFRELTTLRIEIEGFAAERAASARDPGALQAIAAAEAAFRTEVEGSRPDLGRAVALNRDVHFAIYGASGLPLLVEIIRGLWLKAGPVLNPFMRYNPQRMAPAAQFHAAALAAIRAGDGAAARAAIAADVTEAAELIVSAWTA